MPLIKNGAVTENIWTFIDGEGELNDGAPVTLPVDRLLANMDVLTARNAPYGVRLEPHDAPEALVPHLQQLQLIEVSFPKYTDGRGYSHAQLLRRRYGYAGELRAVGHVLQDQIFYMNRSGFDAYETSRADLSGVLEALSEYSEAYQPAACEQVPVFRKRHES